MTDVLIIPAVQPVAPDLQFEFGVISPCAIPINGKPALSYILEHYAAQDAKMSKTVNRETLVVTRPSLPIDFCPVDMATSCHAFEVDYSRDIGHTVLQALNELKPPSRLIVNFADTVVETDTDDADCITFAYRSDTQRWTRFTVDEDGALDMIGDKTSTSDPVSKVFCGVFSLSNPHLFSHLLTQFIASNTNEESFYLALREYTRMVKVTYAEASRWLDFGHIDNYYALQHDISRKAREFNSQSLRADIGVIRKRSQRVTEFIHEIQWYLKIPKSIAFISPRIIDYNLDLNNCYLDMDFYSYLSVQDIWLYSHFDLATWENIFKTIFTIRNAMNRFSVSEDTTGAIANALIEMYYHKTLNRIEQYSQDPRFAGFCQKTVSINGESYPGVIQTADALKANIEKMNLFHTDRFSIIHGDFCFSNILYDRRIGVARLIDPRGRFGEFDIYGDPAYDYAKLCHSVLGNYDFIVQNQFDFNENNGEYTYSVNTKPHHQHIRRLFVNMLQKDRLLDLQKIRFIESLLFLSMVPLHGDNFTAQQTFICRGLEIHHNVLKGIIDI